MSDSFFSLSNPTCSPSAPRSIGGQPNLVSCTSPRPCHFIALMRYEMLLISLQPSLESRFDRCAIEFFDDDFIVMFFYKAGEIIKRIF